MAELEDRILTLHPQGKSGVNISKKKYDQVKAVIVELLNQKDVVGFTEGLYYVEKELQGKFEGKIAWYYVSVKLDMEAKGELVRLPGKGKQMMSKPAGQPNTKPK